MNCMRLDFVSIFKAEDQNGIDRGRHFRWNVTDVAELAVLLYGVRIWAGSKDNSFTHTRTKEASLDLWRHSRIGMM